MMKKIPLIIDCDPGNDDAMCIMMLGASSKYQIEGICAVHGNVPLSMTSKNALFLSSYYGINCPVYKGASEALILKSERAAYVHGSNGLSDYQYELKDETFAEGCAWDFLYETAKKYPGGLELVAVGPLTNVAIAVLKYPELKDLVARVVIMGGAATKGNTTPLAEFNFKQDPHAAAIVLNAGFKDVTVVDLDCCYTAYLNKEEQDYMASLPETNRIHGFVRQNMKQKWISDENIRKKHGTGHGFDRENRMVICDAAAAAAAISPEIAEMRDVLMVVETEGSETVGQSVIDKLGLSGMTNIHLACAIDRDRYAALFMECLKSYEEV